MSFRFSLFAAAALLGVAACGGGGGFPTRTCTTIDDCDPGEVCLDGTCRPSVSTEDGGGIRDTGVDVDPGLRCGPEPWQTGVEVCDGRDNDCDGVIDNGVRNSCGTCEPGCNADQVGPGAGAPFTPGDDNSEGVGLDTDGAIVLDSRRVNTNFIWIASTGSGEVSKVDTTTYAEVARYRTGNDPSRTSVNSFGDVYVGNRNGRSVTKISALGAECPDTNGDGVITTSTGSTSLPFGQDDCMLWRTDTPAAGGIIRAVAAQDVEGPDGELVPYVWAGGWSGRVYKLDGRTGEILIDIPSPTNTYGFALDGRGRLWMASLGNRLGFIDTTRCLDNASCQAEPVCSTTAESDACDGAIRGNLTGTASTDYGITVDFNQRIWLGGSVKRYDPMAPAGSRWATTSTPFCHGIGADAVGFVWAACEGDRSIIRIDANDPSRTHRIATGPNRGIGIDADGKIWGILRHNAPAAAVVRPGAALTEHTLENGVGPTLSMPYTYSDMTGLQLRLATNPRGHYRHVFEGCEGHGVTTEWRELHYDAEIPAGTELIFRIRSAETREGLETADWITVATAPPASSPLDIAAALASAGATHERFVMLEIQLRANRSSSTEVITPRVLGFDLQRVCSSLLL